MNLKPALVFLIGLAPRLVFSLGGYDDCIPDWANAIESLILSESFALLIMALFVLGLALMFSDWQKISKNKEYGKLKSGILLLFFFAILFFGICVFSTWFTVTGYLVLLTLLFLPIGLALMFSDWQKISKSKEYGKSKSGIILLTLAFLLFVIAISTQFLVETFRCF
ncbi:MAG: hypothetical protein NT157_04285 [Candidatus Micrarchaeota archaeon]|nr:hypothetical protein [Candidatus Micrarchaeota archaeon]